VLEEARGGVTSDYNTELVTPYNDINIIMKLVLFHLFVFFHLLIKREPR
jgi:hypothetical protein